jgi:Protein of unknown function (DUF2637)
MPEDQSRHPGQGEHEDGFEPPDLRQLRAIAEREELADARARLADGLGHPLPAGEDDFPDSALEGTAMSAADRAIRASATVAVLGVAGIAAYISYWHAYEVIRAHGKSGVTARLEPATIDGLVYCSSMVVLYAARHQLHVPALARWLLGLGIVATLAANLAHGWSHGPIGATVAAWPAASLVGSYELLLWLIRTAALGAVTNEPAAGRSFGTGSSMVQEAGPSGEDREEDINVAAVAAYRASIHTGKPLSERRLAAMFGKTSRRWARSRMAEARQALMLVKADAG